MLYIEQRKTFLFLSEKNCFFLIRKKGQIRKKKATDFQGQKNINVTRQKEKTKFFSMTLVMEESKTKEQKSCLCHSQSSEVFFCDSNFCNFFSWKILLSKKK
jgi:hypothetical protein